MKMETQNQITGIELALMTVGGPKRTRRTRLAQKVGVTRQTVFNWCKPGDMPAPQARTEPAVLKRPPPHLNRRCAEV